MAKGFCIDGDLNRFYWNTHANVGPGCPNKIEDVQLVQLAYACKAANPVSKIDPATRAIYAKVVPGSHYTGNPNDPLSIAIKTHQKQLGGIQDGVVSSIKNSTGMYSADKAWMLAALNNNLADILGNNWPFLDRHPQCPPALRDVVSRVFMIQKAA